MITIVHADDVGLITVYHGQTQFTSLPENFVDENGIIYLFVCSAHPNSFFFTLSALWISISRERRCYDKFQENTRKITFASFCRWAFMHKIND